MGLFGKKSDPEKLYQKGLQLYDKKKYTEAVRLFVDAAGLEHAASMYMIALCYSHGYGVEKNSGETAQWLRRAAEWGYAKAQNVLGGAYWNGSGVQKDEKLAFYWISRAAEQNEENAFGSVGMLYEFGRGTEQNYEKAREYYKKAVDAGSMDNAVNLGRLYLTGQGGGINYDLAEKYLNMAIKHGDDDAKELLKLLGEAREAQAAQEAAERQAELAAIEAAAREGDAQAQYEFGMGFIMDCYFDEKENDYENAIYWLEKAARQGHEQARRDLVRIAAIAYFFAYEYALPAILWLEQRGDVISYAKKDMAERERVFDNLNGRDFPLELANLDITGEEIPFMVLDIIDVLGKKYPIVISEKPWYSENGNEIMAVRFKRPERLYISPKGGGSSFEGLSDDTREWIVPVGLYEAFIDSAGEADADVLFKRGEEYSCRGMWTKALRLFERAGEMGHLRAQLKAASILTGGVYERYLEPNLGKSVYWYNKAAEQGDAGAQYSLAMRYMTGYGVEKDMDAAVKWLEMSAKQGNKYARNQLSILNRDNEEQRAKKDPKAMRKLIDEYILAASQGDTDAALRMAILCYNGEGVPRDYERAKLYLQESANADDPSVQYYLALIYSEGDENVPRDEEEALEYASMAANQGHEGAKELLKKLGR